MVKTLKDAIKNREVRDEDYPKVAIACEYGGHQAYGHSLKCHSSVSAPVKYVKPLYQALKAFGEPPMVKHVHGSVRFIGTCAEDSAANQVMIENNMATGHFPKLTNLAFTKPIRSRTCQRRDFCDVCQAIF